MFFHFYLLDNNYKVKDNIFNDLGVRDAESDARKKVKKIMESLGWVLDSSDGSHFYLINPGRPELGKVTVPVHGNKELDIRTFSSIKRQTEIDFFKV
ncbi:hypothetical protein FACS189460_3830 [Deltaproteobacteria bacterium]|nr:hypothetical protein FACS189460_3830 [Deltaproteobacteria bacterium]